MKTHLTRRIPLAVAMALAAAVLALGLLAALGVRSLVAGPASAGPAVPNPGHSYDQIELPAGTWTGLDADLLDGLSSDQIQDADDYVSSAGAVSRLGFSAAAVDSAGDVGNWSSMTVGADGLPVVSYYDATNFNLKVAHCGNAACTSGNAITTVDGAEGSQGDWEKSIAIGADGLPLISYYGGANSEFKVAHCGDPACTSGNTITTIESAGQVGDSSSVTVGADGLPIISYFHHQPYFDLKVLHCGNAACTSGNTITTVDSGGVVGDDNSVTVGADGLPVISYRDYTNTDLKVAHCGDAACTSGNTITTVDSAGAVGYKTSVTVGADGLPIISYQDYANKDLKVAHCGNADCTAGNTITTVDSTGDVGVSTSVTVGADGLPLVSYYDYTYGDLKVAHCGNAACTANNSISTVDSAANVGFYSSVTVGADGLPLISYFDDWPNLDLRVAHCSNRFCVPYHRPR